MNIRQNSRLSNKKASFTQIINQPDFKWGEAVETFDQQMNKPSVYTFSPAASRSPKGVKAGRKPWGRRGNLVNLLTTNKPSVYQDIYSRSPLRACEPRDERMANSIAIFDRVGRLVPCDLSLGNICILARPSSLSIALNIKIIKFLISSGRPFEIIKAADFARLSDEAKSDKDIQYFIQIDINNTPYDELLQIIEFCQTKFVLQIPDLKLDHDAQIIDEQNLAFMLPVFGGDLNGLKHLVASLSDEEFLLIKGDKKVICQLPDEIK